MNDQPKGGRVVPVALALCLALSLSVAPASAGSVTVEVADFQFTPGTVKGIGVSETVTWTYDGAGNTHNVHQVNGLFHSGSATSDPFEFQRSFSAGIYPYVCQIHPSLMSGTVRVPLSLVPDADGGALPLVTWADAVTNTGKKFDVQYRVGTNKWKTWFKDTTRFAGTFGEEQMPIKLRKGKVYRFRARSQKSGKTSKWSPTKKYVHD